MAALLRESDKLRLFRDSIDIEQIMPPTPLYAVWPTGAEYVPVADLYQTFARDPKLLKLLSQQTVLRSVADAVRRGLLALRCKRPDGSYYWFWKSEPLLQFSSMPKRCSCRRRLPWLSPICCLRVYQTHG